MKVILLEDVKGLGKAKQVVEVKEGYGHNFLIAKGLAEPLTSASAKKLNKENSDIDQKHQRAVTEAENKKEIINDKLIRIHLKSNEGKLFGTVSHKDIADAIERDYHMTVDKKKIHSPEIKHLGLYEISIKLHPQVTAVMKLEVQ